MTAQSAGPAVDRAHPDPGSDEIRLSCMMVPTD